MTNLRDTAQASETIAAPAEQIWELVSDITRTGEWSPENVGGTWLGDATGPAVGARFKATNRRGKVTWSKTCEVTSATPGQEFAFVTGTAAKPETAWRYLFEPVDDGTRVTESFEMVKPLGPLKQLFTRVTTGVADRQADLGENLRVSLARIKAVAES